MRLSREYIVPVTFTVVFHSLLLAWLLGSFMSNDRVFELPQPKMVRASLVSLEQKKKKGPQQEFRQPKPKDPEPVAKAEPEPKPRPKPKEPEPKPEPKPKEPEAKPQPKPEPKPEVKPLPKVDEQKLKQEAEKKRLQEEAKLKQAEAEKKRLQEEQKRKQAEEKRKQAEAEKKRREEQQRREQALLDSIEGEKFQEEADPDSTETVSAESYIALIQRAVINNWSRPISARNGMQVLLKIQLIPTGEVVGVTVYKSSGDYAFDRSAVAAVEKAHSFPELAELDSRTFESKFRSFILNFNPQDLRF